MKKNNQRYFLVFFSTLLLVACSPAKRLKTSAKANVINAPSLATAHVGISIFDATENKYLYNYQAHKYFVPASNIKIATCYAAMKYLGDSLVGLRYQRENNFINIIGTGDPTFLHPDFKSQPVFSFLQNEKDIGYVSDRGFSQFSFWGRGWTYDDYQQEYMVERSELPIYGNVATFFMQGDTTAVIPSSFYNDHIRYHNSVLKNGAGWWFTVARPFENNLFYAPYSNAMYKSKTKFQSQDIPFRTILNPSDGFNSLTFVKLLADTLHTKIHSADYTHGTPFYKNKIYTQPVDSLLKPMMHRSDNFFAEQTLLMVSNEVLGVMNDAKIIDTILKTDFKDLPQKPRWADGSGLSRYNLFTPQDFVAILNKMKNEFGMARIKEIFATGGEGTISSYYKKDSSFLYAKTGTLSGVVALSGFMYTAKNKLFLFSVLVNNHQASSTEVRRAVEKFIQDVRKRY